MPTVTRQIQVRQGTAAQWAAANTVLLAGEPGITTDSGVMAWGDGSTPWNNLFKTRIGADKTYSDSDNFNRANQNFVTDANWDEHSYNYAGEAAQISSQQVTGGNGNRYIIRKVPVPAGTPYAVQFDVLNLQTGTGNSDTGLGVVIGALSSGNVSTYNGTAPRSAGLVLRLPGRGAWEVGTRAQLGADGPAVIASSTSVSLPASGLFRVEVTPAGVVTMKYAGTTLWSGSPAFLQNAPGRQVGLCVNSSNTLDNFVAAYAAL